MGEVEPLRTKPGEQQLGKMGKKKDIKDSRKRKERLFGKVRECREKQK